ncbi:hypothetical protein BY996DRAFT_6412010 [Phakopsora pachyrhizi]|nr:hypothetical protein BY996DRAFT_6412009 [Phakopsora pachyrhizi]KAI8456923.1 hypothetical protein BY996DRAFT_6412010 [Phakopsora pachyrhizi]
MCGCCLEKWIPPRLNPFASTEKTPDTSGASSPEANQSTVQNILRGGGWSFGTLNRTKSNSTQALFTPSEQVKQLPLVIQYALPIVSIASVWNSSQQELKVYALDCPTQCELLILPADCVESCFDWIYSGIEMVSIFLSDLGDLEMS